MDSQFHNKNKYISKSLKNIYKKTKFTKVFQG